VNDMDGTLKLLTRLTETLEPGNRTREAFYRRLDILESLGRADEIARVYPRMAARLPDDSRVQSDFAWYLAETGNDLEKAEAVARAAIVLDPEAADSHDTLARVLFRQGRLEEAVEASEKAIELDGGNVLYRERRLEYVQALRRRMREGG